jgi:hypothetical protein
MENPVRIHKCHTGKAGKTWETRDTERVSVFTPVSSALRREYNSHSMRSKLVQPVDAAAKLPHNHDAAACAAVLHGNFAADLSVGLNKMPFMEYNQVLRTINDKPYG